MADKYFEKALNNFISDFAEGDAIRKFADKGYSVARIKEMLTYPLPEQKISEIVWEHYLDTGIVRLDKPKKQDIIKKVSYIREYDDYGRSSFRQVVEETMPDEREYIECDFGKRKYQNQKEYEEWLSSMDSKDREYIIGLPWPVDSVYHIADDRMKRINR